MHYVLLYCSFSLALGPEKSHEHNNSVLRYTSIEFQWKSLIDWLWVIDLAGFTFSKMEVKQKQNLLLYRVIVMTSKFWKKLIGSHW